MKIRQFLNNYLAKNINEKAESLVIDIVHNLHREVISNAPKGEISPADGERPSMRLHGQTLVSSFHTSIVRSGKNVFGELDFRHPTVGGTDGSILDWLTKGTRRHDIPKDELDHRLVFWSGSPLRWNKVNGGQSGIYGLWAVDHPGIRSPYKFLDDSFEAIETDLDRLGERTLAKL